MIFFIWIGCIKDEALEYIDIWMEVIGNVGKVEIYYDSHFLLFNHYSAKFKKIFDISDEESVDRIVECQSCFKAEIDDFIHRGCTFDEAFILRVKKFSLQLALSLETELTLARERISRLKERYNFIDVRDNASVFFDAFFNEIDSRL